MPLNIFSFRQYGPAGYEDIPSFQGAIVKSLAIGEVAYQLPLATNLFYATEPGTITYLLPGGVGSLPILAEPGESGILHVPLGTYVQFNAL